MAVVATEGALDLSNSSKQPLEIKPHSPVPSITSDTDSQGCEAVPEPARERSESVSSDGHETDSSTTTAVKPILGHNQALPSHSETVTEKKVFESQNSNITSNNNNNTTSPGSVRPFKMYPFDPMPGLYSQMAAAATTASPGLFPMAATSALPLGGMMDTGPVSLSSPIMSYLHSRKRRAESRSSTESQAEAKKQMTDDSKDNHYWERRRKNNEAAKRSRDARRCKEEEIALRAAFLEQENLKLRAQVAILKNETAKLHYMLYNRM